MLIWNGSVVFINPNKTLLPPPVNIDWFLGATFGIVNPGTFEQFVDTNLTDSTPVIVYDQAMFVFFTFGHNFYHVMSEYMPTVHTVLCRYLGLCRYDAASTLQMIMVDPFDIHTENWAQPVNPRFSRCVSGMPVRHVSSPQWNGSLVLLRRAIAGWGTEARADHGHIHHWYVVQPVCTHTACTAPLCPGVRCS